MLGVTLLRHDATIGQENGKADASFEAVLPALAAACREVTEYAAAKGIRTMVENHGYFCQGSARVKALIERVDHPNFGALIDMGNFLCTDETPLEAVTAMLPYAFHVHCKDFHVLPADSADPGAGWFRSLGGRYLRGAIIGHGNVQVKRCLDRVRASGYDRCLVMEFEGMEPPFKAIEIGLANIKAYWTSPAL